MNELIRLGKSTYYVTGLFHVGVYVLPHSDEAVDDKSIPVCLIDSGLDTDTAKDIDDLLAKNNFIVSLIINTHYHADHTGGNAFFKQKYDCKILATKLNAALISNYDICPAMVWGACPIPETKNNYFYAIPTETEDISANTLPAGITIEELPGHCISMIAVRTCDDVIFLGDAVISPDTIAKNHLSYIYEIGDYLCSLDKLQNIKAALYVPYHSEPTRDIKGLVAANREGVLSNIAAIKKLCEIPRTQEELMSEFYNSIGHEINLYRYAIEGSIFRNYLAYLYNCNELEVVIENNFVKWHTKL